MLFAKMQAENTVTFLEGQAKISEGDLIWNQEFVTARFETESVQFERESA
jgi:hypothetical protein